MHWVARAAAVSLLGTLLLGCGGKSSSQGNGDSTSKPTRHSCDYAGTTYDDGEAFVGSDGCSSCTCQDGTAACLGLSCALVCMLDGQYYAEGPIERPGREQCSCASDGSVSCNLLPIPVPQDCEQLAQDYNSAVQSAKACDPDKTGQCEQRVSASLICGCQTFVNEASWDNDQAEELAGLYEKDQCSAGIACGPCQSPPVRGFCNVDGLCMDSSDIGGETGCKVDGIIYPSGAGGIPDPTSCNTCTCDAGQLSCTEIGCPKPCPAKTKLATSCAQCGPNDGCEIVEYSCRPTCTDTCAEGSCIDGACLVGICG